jgi:hypothetical protein
MMIKNLSWIGTAASIVGSFVIAFGFMQFGYLAFLLGSTSWLIVGILNNDKPLMVLNGTFFVANIIGLYRAFV